MTDKLSFVQALEHRDPTDFSLEVRSIIAGVNRKETLAIPDPAPTTMDELVDWLASSGFEPGRWSLRITKHGRWLAGERKTQEAIAPLRTIVVIPGEPVQRVESADDDDEFADARAVAADTQRIKNETARLKASQELEATRTAMAGGQAGDGGMTALIFHKLDAMQQPRSTTAADVLKILVPLGGPVIAFVQTLVMKGLSGGATPGAGMKEFLALFSSFQEIAARIKDGSGDGEGGDQSFLGEMATLVNSVKGLTGSAPEPLAAGAAATPAARVNGPVPAPAPLPEPEQLNPEQRGVALARDRVRELAELLEVEFFAGADPIHVSEQLDNSGAIASLPTPVRRLFETGRFQVQALREWLDDEQLKRVIETFGTANGLEWIVAFASDFGEPVETEDDGTEEQQGAGYPGGE